jgi:hypothetical protein
MVAPHAFAGAVLLAAALHFIASIPNGLVLGPRPSWRCAWPPRSPKPRRAACCATKPIGRSAIAVASPKSFVGATALRSGI